MRGSSEEARDRALGFLHTYDKGEGKDGDERVV